MSFGVRCSLMASLRRQGVSRPRGRRQAGGFLARKSARPPIPVSPAYANLSPMSFPALDLARFEAASPGERRAIGAEIDAICRATGFLTLVGHGVPQPVIDGLW